MQCKHCRKTIREKDSRVTVPLGSIHQDCMDDFINKTILKNRLKKQQAKKELKDEKKKTKLKSKLEVTQKIFNEFIRRRDAHNIGKCISCKSIVRYGKANYSAGHYFTRGSRSDLRFNENNVFGQCNKCNCYGDAETMIRFKENVIKKIGQKEFDTLRLRQKQDYSEYGLKKIQKIYREKINKLKKKYEYE